MAAPSQNSPRPARAAGVTWLALALSLGYLAVMAIVMWLFESAISLTELAQLVGDPKRINAWVLIACSSALVFVVTRWGLHRSGAVHSTDAVDAESGGQTAAAPRLRSSWALLAGLGLIFSATGGYVVVQQEDALDRARYRQFAMVGQMKANLVERWIDERRRDVLVLLENDGLAAAVKQAIDSGGLEPLHGVTAMVEANRFDGAVVVDRAGTIRFNFPEDRGAREECRAMARAGGAVRGSGPVLSHAFAGSDGKPKLDAIGRLSDPDVPGAPHLATVCIRIDLSLRLLPAVSTWPVPSRTGEVLLGRIDGEDVIVINHRTKDDGEDRGWQLRRLEGARDHWDAARAATQAGHLHERELAAGRALLRAVYAVPDSPWMVLARMDAEEADLLQARAQRRIAIVGGFGLIFTIAVAMLAWVRNRASVELQQAEREALLRKLEDLAYYDELTGLPRRQLTEDRLNVVLAHAHRNDGDAGVLFVDLDGFKAINDSHGHAAGDAVLKGVAERMRACVRDGDTVGRVGGDEFLVVLPGAGALPTLERIATKVLDAIRQPIDWNGTMLAVGASIGSAAYPRHGSDAGALVRAADHAMYRIKEARGGVRIAYG